MLARGTEVSLRDAGEGIWICQLGDQAPYKQPKSHLTTPLGFLIKFFIQTHPFRVLKSIGTCLSSFCYTNTWFRYKVCQPTNILKKRPNFCNIENKAFKFLLDFIYGYIWVKDLEVDSWREKKQKKIIKFESLHLLIFYLSFSFVYGKGNNMRKRRHACANRKTKYYNSLMINCKTYVTQNSYKKYI